MALAAVAALTGVALSIQKIIDINGKLSDAQSDVMKTTGMTKDEVDELTKSFGLLHTPFF
jgi:tubulin-specific chaperone A